MDGEPVPTVPSAPIPTLPKPKPPCSTTRSGSEELHREGEDGGYEEEYEVVYVPANFTTEFEYVGVTSPLGSPRDI